MLAATYTVVSTESRRFNLDCRPWLDETETVFSARAEVEPATDPEFFVTSIYVRQGERVVYLTAGGKDQEDYKVTFHVGTSDGQVRTTCVLYRVRDECRGAAPL